MSRATAFRFTRPDTVFVQQEAALECTMYIVRELGPTCFVIQEQQADEGAGTKSKGGCKVTLGDPHTCNCEYYKKERDLCKHIIWLLLRRFRIDRNEQLGWQLGLVQREIDELVSGVERRRLQARRQQQQQQQTSNSTSILNLKQQALSNKQSGVQQRPIEEEDVCPICQENLLEKRQPISFCSQSCGNNVHIKCMKVWADHQRANQQNLSTDDSQNPVPCPMCRGTFCTYESLKQQFHNSESGARLNRVVNQNVSIPCSNCRKQIAPNDIHYRCVNCASVSNAAPDFILCKQCFNQPAHLQHDRFEYRQKTTGKWKLMTESRSACIQINALPNALVTNLMNRDITENDYDLLLQLDNNAPADSSQIPERVLQRFRVETLAESNKLLLPGMQCLVCLKQYRMGDQVKTLPKCKHKFHVSCIDNWLIHHRSTCPVDGTVVWSRDQESGPAAAARPNGSPSHSSATVTSKKPAASANRTASGFSALSVNGSRLATSAAPVRQPTDLTISLTQLRVTGNGNGNGSSSGNGIVVGNGNVAKPADRPSAKPAAERAGLSQIFVGKSSGKKAEEHQRQKVRPPKPLYRVPGPSRDAATAHQLAPETTHLSIAGSSNAEPNGAANMPSLVDNIRPPVASILHRLSSITNP